MITNLILSALLPVLAQRESGGNPSAIGKAGERGLYQWTQAAWEDCSKARHREGYSISHFDKAFHRDTARIYTSYWLRRLHTRITKAQHAPATLAQVLSAWNCGEARLESVGWNPARCPRSTRKYVADIERAMKGKK